MRKSFGDKRCRKIMPVSLYRYTDSIFTLAVPLL